MPPLCRKKQVLDRYNPDSFRVISNFAEESHPQYEREHTENISEWRKQWRANEGLALPDIYNRKTEVLPHEAPDYRINKPHPGSCGFLRHNVRLLNEPICTVFTEVTRAEQQNWWPSRISTEPLQIPPKTKDTIYRGDYQEREKTCMESFGSMRHTANPNTEPALGTVPVNFLSARDGKQRLFKEKISYEHQYNSRFSDNYPIRGKRQGSFVWNQMTPDASKKFIDHYKIISAEEGIVRQQQMEIEKNANNSTLLTEIMTEQPPAELSMPKEEPVVEQPIGELSLPKAEPSPLKVEQNEPLAVQVTDPAPQKLASPPGSKKISPKSSPQHSPQQKASPKSSPHQSPKQRESPKNSPKQSPNHSRKNSNSSGNKNGNKSENKSSAGNNIKTPELISVNIINNLSDNSQNIEAKIAEDMAE